MTQENKKISTKMAFFGGLIGGLLIISSIGFFVLLGFFLKGDVEAVENRAPVAKEPVPVETEQAQGIDKKISLAPVTGDDHIRGARNAPVTIVEYSDTECPFCKRFHNTMLEVMEEYGDRVRWVYRHAPLDSLHRNARQEAEASECASEQGKFWEYIDRLFAITPSNDGLEYEQLTDIAEYVSLNKTGFETCLESGKYEKKVQSHLQDAVSAGMRGTPYSVIMFEDKKIPVSGAYSFSQMKNILDNILN
ncbi:MAG: thioredoxin domain-containing protein [Candidatus Magasanikbacteria bacterium]|nr:thioredoxin domain-containing protein [Candidatus Magasanikbacteria bacterium]